MKTLNMSPNNSKGYLFTFCGLDGCGKTTMLTKLKEELESNYKVFLTKQPTDAVRKSDIFRTYMDCPNHDAYDYRSLSLLAASDRLQHINKVIKPQMENGNIVISDRYFYSCLANLRARGFNEDNWIYEVAEFVVKPDVSFFFDVPVESAVKRVRSRENEKDRYIDMELQYRLRDEYIAICKANNGILISTEMPIEECYTKVKSEVERVIKNEY
ncbi:MAG: dTMP kinase [Ruminococcaceae bacterium]|nr:dTMP kinase [Oscillospiraceae bacterium]